MKLFTFLSLTFLLCFQPSQSHAQLEADDLTWEDLKQAFNDVADKPAVLSILSVNCPPCRTHRDDIRDDIMNQCDNPDLHWFIVWFEDPGHPSVRADAESQAFEINDGRVTQWWYNEHQSNTAKNDSIALLFGDASWMGCNYAWDISMLFEAGATWGNEPPQPNYCMAKVTGCCNFYNINNFVNAVNGLDVCDETTAVNGLLDKDIALLECYPNPVYQTATIRYQLPEKNGSVVISDVTGRIVKTYSLSNSKGAIVLPQQFEKGIYYCSLWSKEKLLGVRKVYVL